MLGWTATGAGGVAVPARFQTATEAEEAVFNSTCVHNLAVHLPRLKEMVVGIVAKPCDQRSVVELIAEHEVDADRVKVIEVDCQSMVDVKAVWRRFGFGATIEDNGPMLRINDEEVERNGLLLNKCHSCEDRNPALYDEIAAMSEKRGGAAGAGYHHLREQFDAMNIAERRAFWEEQYTRCIRCYACREACPMCYCRDVCIMQTREPHWIGGEVNAREAEMMQLIRVNHLAGRCTGCGECERACPMGIPLMLLMEEQNQIVEEMFGYRAGTDPEKKPPLLTFDIKADTWNKKNE